MNQSVKKLLFFIGTAVLITGLIYVTSGGDDVGTDGPEGEIITVKEFKSRCDSLKIKRWDKEEFDRLQATLIAMKSNEVVNATDASNLNIYLNQSYASTLKDSCSSWLSTNGETADRKLFSELESIAQNQECSKMLSSELQNMRAYFAALQIPGKVRSFTQSKFSLDQYSSLLSLVKNTSQNAAIKHFNSMRKIAADAVSQLSDFRAFAINYDKFYNFYVVNKDNPDALENIRNFCPERNPITARFSFYLNEIKMQKEICN